MERLSRPWSTRALRLTAFLRSPVEAIDPNTWASATGETPEIDQSQPRQQVRTQAGPFGSGFLTFQVQGLLQRLDWLMVPAPASDPTEIAVEFGPVGEALDVFNKLVHVWLAGTEIKANRLAAGIVAVIPSPDHVSAYRALQEFLPCVKIDAEHSRDLSYTINRPKPSRSLGPETELNRLTHWSVLRIQAFVSTAPTSTGIQLRGAGGLYVSVDCDNSTPAEREDLLDKAKFVDTYDELMEMALQNLEHGELA